MRAVVQRVEAASVVVGGHVVGAIDSGLLVLLGVADNDGPEDVHYIASKLHGLRIFGDEAGKMNLAVAEAGGELLVVSQFTLYGDCRKGRRPSFDRAAPPALAKAMYEAVVLELRALGLRVATGEFQAHMQVHLVNDGPVTVLLDSARAF
jgi:D-tyrosyl-tRNA(Tyr) deacylase